MTFHDLWLWYIQYQLPIRGFSYLIVMFFFCIWGVWALRHGLYHRAAIKLLLGLVMMSFVIRSFDSDPRWSYCLTTPALSSLAITVIAFLFRLKKLG